VVDWPGPRQWRQSGNVRGAVKTRHPARRPSAEDLVRNGGSLLLLVEPGKALAQIAGPDLAIAFSAGEALGNPCPQGAMEYLQSQAPHGLKRP